MSLDSLQKTLETDTPTLPTLARKETRILSRSQTASSGRNFPASSLRSREQSTARSLDALCDPEYTTDDRQGRLTARYRSTTLGHLPSATQSDYEYWWNTRHRPDTSENLVHGGLRSSEKSSSSQSPLVVEMAREIEHLKSELAAFQSGQRLVVNRNGCYNADQSDGMANNGNLTEQKDSLDVLIDSSTSPMIRTGIDYGGSRSPLIQPPSSLAPSADKRTGKQDFHDSWNRGNITDDGPDGTTAWFKGARGQDGCQQFNVNELPSVLELRAQVAQLQDQLRSVAVNPSEDAAFGTSLLEKCSASGSVSAESKTVTQLRRMIQVRSTVLLVFTSTKAEVMQSVWFICPVFLRYVCEQDYCKSNQHIILKLVVMIEPTNWKF